MIEISYHQYSLDQGECTISMPAKMTAEEFGLFEEWIALVMKGQKRRVAVVKAPTEVVSNE